MASLRGQGTSRKTPSVVATWAQRSGRGQDPRHLEVIGKEEVLLTRGLHKVSWALAKDDETPFFASFLGSWDFLAVS